MSTNDGVIQRLVETAEQQNEIINLQSNAIESLFELLSQFVSVSEIDQLPCIKDINRAAEIKREITI